MMSAALAWALARLPAALRGPGLYVVLALLAVALGWVWLRWAHDPAVREAYRVEIERQTAAKLADYREAAEAALADAAADAERRAAATATLRERIIHVPVATACVASPAVAAAVDGLRRAAAGGAGAPADTGQPARLPGRP